MSLANNFEDFKREIELIVKQNPLECELYSIIAAIMRERDNAKSISIRDVSNIKSTPDRQKQKDRMYKFEYNDEDIYGALDFVILDSSYRYSKGIQNKILGAIEVKAVHKNLDKEKEIKKNQFIKSLSTFKKVIYTNALEWRLYQYNSESETIKLEWNIILGEYLNKNTISDEILDNDEIKWKKCEKWYELLKKLDEIQWMQNKG